METGHINIIIEEGKTPSVEAQLTNNNLWLTKNEIARLLNCFPQQIEANLRSIFKAGLLLAEDCTYNYRYTDKGIEKQRLYYNLDVLIFLSYRINTFEANIFRDFVHSALRKHLQKKTSKRNPILWYSVPKQSFRWN